MTGLLLGDGCLYKFTENSNPVLLVKRSYKDKQYLEYQYDLFKEFYNSGIKVYERLDNRTNKIYKTASLSSRSSEVFNAIYNKWYISSVKIVPEDIVLSPLTCAIWFCDDGNVSCRNNRLFLKLSTHGFDINSVHVLQNYLNNIFPLSYFSIFNDNGNYYIGSADSGAKDFINYIDGYIPPCMSRKITWDDAKLSSKRISPHLKFRKDFDLNNKEISIMKCLICKQMSSLEICTTIKWLSNGKPPSSYFRYLNKFLDKKWIEPVYLVINGKRNTKYKITEIGTNIYHEALSFNIKSNKI